MNPADLKGLLDFAVDAARHAGDITLRYFNKGVVPELKADRTPVTIADRSAEQYLRERISVTYPSHGILGEEFGESPGRDAGRWILDPIDGTVSFVCGVPLYCVLVGFEWAGEMAAGVIHMPALGETVYAARGLGCWWNGARAQVSGIGNIGEARLLCCGAKTLYASARGAAYDRLRDAVGLERGWSDGYAYALLATGRAEIVIDPRMALWDNAALMPVVTEAGGTFTDWSGAATHTAPEAVATNGLLFEPVMRLIAG